MAEGQVINRALGALLDIMLDPNIKEAQCIEAARAIIEYEAPPEVFDLTYEYLIGVAEREGQDVGLKLKALELIRKVGAKRVVPGTAKAADTAAAMALGRGVATARRRLELVRAGEWPPKEGWADNIGEVRGIVFDEEGIAERLEAARIASRGP